MWGNMDTFISYTHSLIPWMPTSVVPFLGWTATVLELLFAALLLAGLKLKLVSLLTGLMILTFALAMATSIGLKAPLDYSAFNASAAAFAIIAMGKGRYEMDNLFKKKAL